MNKKLSKMLVLALSFMMVFTMSMTAFATDEGETTPEEIQEETQIVKSNYMNGTPEEISSADGWAKVSKTLEETGVENEFKVNLEVKTKCELDKLQLSSDAAVILVVDTSFSMIENNDKKDRMEDARQATTKFIESFKQASANAGNAKRKIGIVNFDINDGETATITQSLSDVNTTDYTSAINRLVTDSKKKGTNIYAGIRTAYKMFTDYNLANESNPSEKLNPKDCYIVLLTDGEPNLPTKNNNTKYPYNSAKSVAGEFNTFASGSASESHIYSVFVGNNKEMADFLNEFSANEVKQTGSDTSGLIGIFQDFEETILKFAEAWQVKDPMGENILFKNFVDANGSTIETPNFVSNGNGNFTWRLREDHPVRYENDEGDVIEPSGETTEYWKVYALSYTIRLDNTGDISDLPNAVFNTNGDTVLSYCMNKEDGNYVPEDFQELNFEVPQVKSYVGNFSFTKTDKEENPIKVADEKDRAMFSLYVTSNVGTKVFIMTATSDENGIVSFENIPSGHDYKLVETKAPKGYIKDEASKVVKVSYGDVTIDGDTYDADTPIVWKNEPQPTQLTVKKVWNDYDNAEKSRPGSIDLQLYKNGAPYSQDIITLREENNWTEENIAIEPNDSGIVDEWTAEEVNVPKGYTSSVETTVENGVVVVTVTNALETQFVNISGTKTWVHGDNTDFPASITVNLYKNGTKIDSKPVTGEGDVWNYSFTGLEKYNKEDGTLNVYTVSEDPVDNYITTQDRYNFTNTYEPNEVSINGTKTWNDDNDRDGLRPSSITIRLFANEVEVESKTVTAEANWQWNFTVPKYDENGEKIVYTITEDEVAGYETTINGYSVTNTHVSQPPVDPPVVPPVDPPKPPVIPDPQPPVVEPEPDPLPPDENLPEEPDTPDVDRPELPDDEYQQEETDKPDVDRPELPGDEYQMEEQDQPKTGDSQNMAGWTAILMASLAMLGVTLAVKRKEEEK